MRFGPGVPAPPDPDPYEVDAPPLPDIPTGSEATGALSPEVVNKVAKTAKDLDEDLQRKLLDLAKKTVDSYSVARLGLVKSTQEARNFWKGLQNLKWNPVTKHFDQATATTQEAKEEIEPTTLNIFQANGLSLVSALSATAPHGIAMPEDGENPDDVATAKAYSKIITRFERVNQIENILAQEIQYAYTDGYYGLFVRHKVDGDRFGYRETQEMESQPITMPGLGGDTTSAVPRNVGAVRVANGEEVVDVMGALELSIPPYGRSQYDYPAIEWQTESPVSLLRAIYAERIEEISEGGEAGDGTANATERTSRLLLANASPGYDGREGNTSSPELVTYKRTWLRKWAFYALEDKETRDKFIELFPDGAYVAHAGDLLLDARNECMDDHWTIVQPLPGDGSYREPVGGSLMPIQRAVNNLLDRQLQNDAFGVPPIFYDTDLLDGDAYHDTTVRPGKAFPLTLKPGQNLSGAMWSPPPAQIHQGSTDLRDFLIGVAALLTGVQPALYGGEEEGAGGSTSSGYAMARDQAMGRVGLIYRAIKHGHARMNDCLMRIMAKERKENIVIPTETDDGSFKNDVIQVSDLKGRVKVSAEQHEDVPVTWAQHKNLLQAMYDSQNPTLQAIASAPQNLALFKRTNAWEELHIPGEDSQNEQDEETAQLVKDGAPIEQTDPMGMPILDPVTGQPLPPRPTVPTDPMDNHEMHYARCQEFKESAEGRKLKRENPPAYQNFHLHAMEHFANMQPPMPPPGAEPAPPQGGQ
jgi:hypothetical protein